VDVANARCGHGASCRTIDPHLTAECGDVSDRIEKSRTSTSWWAAALGRRAASSAFFRRRAVMLSMPLSPEDRQG
jgi:hypothetical protein